MAQRYVQAMTGSSIYTFDGELRLGNAHKINAIGGKNAVANPQPLMCRPRLAANFRAHMTAKIVTTNVTRRIGIITVSWLSGLI